MRLRLTSEDVVHGFAVGRLGFAPVDVLPGQVTEVTLTFDEPGTYTFYCTRWCGPDHWRMRGTIEVEGAGPAVSSTIDPPAYVELGLDIDAPHPAPAVPSAPPSATRAALLSLAMPDAYRTASYYRSHSPGEVWIELRADSLTSSLSDDQVWDLVAWLWERQTSPEGLAEGRDIFRRECAACHGEIGAGDGVFAEEIAASAAPAQSSMAPLAPPGPADFTRRASMFGAPPALLQGKILRGGMGTGMPDWGSILTDDQIWAVIGYLYSISFSEDGS
jgi:mono/diheme cytochrome c family protein